MFDPPLGNELEFECYCDECIDYFQVHGHRRTCRHGPIGKERCRLTKPSVTRPCTGCEQVVENADPLAFLPTILPTVLEENAALGEGRNRSEFSLSAPDFRAIAYELCRPEMQDLENNRDGISQHSIEK